MAVDVIDTIDYRKCTGPCGATLPITTFWKSGARGKRRSRCRECCKADLRAARVQTQRQWTINRINRTIDKAVQQKSSNTSWKPLAACRGVDETFHPPVDPKQGVMETTREAMLRRRYCRWCPVRKECLEWALQNKETEGLWGGVPQKARVQAIKNRKSAEELLEKWR